jgi:hypothetical protein
LKLHPYLFLFIYSSFFSSMSMHSQ